MIVEFGNQAAFKGIDDAPKVTTVHVPDPDEEGLGGYTHKPDAITVDEFRLHRQEATDYRGGVTRLGDHEALLAIVSAWPQQSGAAPTWVNVIPGEMTAKGVAEDVQKFLSDHYQCPEGKPMDVEDTHWTRFGAPGVFPDSRPKMEMLYTNSGRVISNVNDGGGQVGVAGTGTAATATTLTTASTFTTNQWAGYRVYAMQTATGPLVWGNITLNTNAAGASVLTVDRWYNAATPGGAAATAPSAGFYFMIPDGGMVSSWFVGMTTTNITPAAADTALTGEYTTAGGGYIRKIAPYAQTSGVASRSITLTPVFTGNGSDTYPQTFYAIGVFTGMVAPAFSGSMKFETTLNASATVAASGDQITITETITGS